MRTSQCQLQADADNSTFLQVAVGMTSNFGDSLNCLKLEDGVGGICQLKAPWEDISEIFSDPPCKHLHILARHPPTGEFE
jgi:hypothetical protein